MGHGAIHGLTFYLLYFYITYLTYIEYRITPLSNLAGCPYVARFPRAGGGWGSVGRGEREGVCPFLYRIEGNNLKKRKVSVREESLPSAAAPAGGPHSRLHLHLRAAQPHTQRYRFRSSLASAVHPGKGRTEKPAASHAAANLDPACAGGMRGTHARKIKTFLPRFRCGLRVVVRLEPFPTHAWPSAKGQLPLAASTPRTRGASRRAWRRPACSASKEGGAAHQIALRRSDENDAGSARCRRQCAPDGSRLVVARRGVVPKAGSPSPVRVYNNVICEDLHVPQPGAAEQVAHHRLEAPRAHCQRHAPHATLLAKVYELVLEGQCIQSIGER
eukprot:scaffold164_cov105-Isochrysis_galbana.AAC.4